MPIAADQAVFTPADVYDIVRQRAADAIVLSPHEAGGLLAFGKAAAIAEAAGVPVCLHGQGVSGITDCAQHHLGLSTANLTDGNQIMHQLLVEDLVSTPDLTPRQGKLGLVRRAGARRRARPRRGRPRRRALREGSRVVTVAPYPEFFNDVFGPVMQPGSSSHTAGPCRLAYLAGCLLGEPVAKVLIELDKEGSFAGTFGIMAEDRAMVAGVLGYLPDDRRLFRSFELAEEAGVEVGFSFTEIVESKHPNAMKFILTGQSGLMVELVGDSTGGGMVETVMVDGFPYRTLGDAFVLLVQDPQEALSNEKIERLRAELPDVVDAQEVRVAGRGVLYAFALPVEPDLVALREVTRRRRAGAPAGAAAAAAAGRQPARPQAAALRHHDALARARGGTRCAALGGRRPVRDGRVRLAARLGGRPHAGAGAGHAAADARGLRGGRRPSSTPSSSRTSPAAGRGTRRRRRGSATASRRGPSSTRTAPAPASPASRTSRGRWAAGRATSTPPSAPCRRPAA